jgi:pilus assembly protein Flp/PilA
MVAHGTHDSREERKMLSSLKRAWRLLADESGPTAVEYAVLLALIVTIVLASIKTVGKNSNKVFKNVGKSITSKAHGS